MIPALMILGSLVYAGYSTYKEEKLKENASSAICLASNNEIATQFEPIIEKQDVTLSKPVSDYEVNNEIIDHYLKVSGVALGSATLAAIIYPPLNLITLPLLLYSCIPVFKNAFNSIFIEKRIRASVVDTIAIVGTYITGYYLIGSLGTLIYFWGSKLIQLFF